MDQWSIIYLFTGELSYFKKSASAGPITDSNFDLRKENIYKLQTDNLVKGGQLRQKKNLDALAESAKNMQDTRSEIEKLAESVSLTKTRLSKLDQYKD